MGKYDKYSIPENMSFDPKVVRNDIEELERIAAKGSLSHAGYAELKLLKDYEEFLKEKSENDTIKCKESNMEINVNYNKIDNEIKNDIENLLSVARPKLIEAYKNGDATSHHKVSQEFIPVANRVFMYLHENSNLTWFAFEALGSSLCNPIFWKYTDLVHSFCDYLELRNREAANASA